MKIHKKVVPTHLGEVSVYRIENSRGAWVELSEIGAGVIGVGVPDREGRIENVCLSYGDIEDYMGDGPAMGKCPGRYANRIAFGRFRIGGKEYQLDTNLPPHHLHGGATGFHNRIWDSETDGTDVIFHRLSPDGEEGYPGNMEVSVRYNWDDDDRLTLSIKAVCDADTVVNITNHGYWNLRGADSGTTLDHEMRMRSSRCLVTDDKLVPTGEFAEVAGTPMDFLAFKTLGRDIHADFAPLLYGKGYDHCYLIDGWEPGRMSSEAVMLRERTTGRTLTVDSDQPGVQIYTGNWLKGCPRSRTGREYEDYDGVAVEMQGLPDAPNHPGFPSQELHPGEEYLRKIIYAFGCE